MATCWSDPSHFFFSHWPYDWSISQWRRQHWGLSNSDGGAYVMILGFNVLFPVLLWNHACVSRLAFQFLLCFFSLHYLTCPLPSSLTSPLPNPLVSVSVYIVFFLPRVWQFVPSCHVSLLLLVCFCFVLVFFVSVLIWTLLLLALCFSLLLPLSFCPSGLFWFSCSLADFIFVKLKHAFVSTNPNSHVCVCVWVYV